MPTILVADDSPVVRHLLGVKLRGKGITVVEAECAHDASDVDPFSIDAAVLDLDLGDGDGATVAETLRAKCTDLPLAFFSSETKGPNFLRATAISTIFSKDDADAVVAWAVAAVANRG